MAVTQPTSAPGSQGSAGATAGTGSRAATPSDLARSDHLDVFRGLLPFVWPEGRPDLRRRVVIAFVILVIAKFVTVAVPIAFKEATDALTALSTADSQTRVTAALGFALTAMIAAYGLGRVMMVVLNNVRDVFFTEVGQNAVRSLNIRTFRHLHALSLRFHLERRTGGLSRVVERATRAIELIIRTGILNIVPTFIEFLLIAAVLFYYFNWLYVVIILATVVGYTWFTLVANTWRVAIRREMNDSDTEANTKAIDSLLNFETVKYFGNEEMETRRFDVAMARYEKAAIKTYRSLAFLNCGQAVIFTAGMTLSMYMAARGVAAGTYTVGDFVMVNALLIQLYVPLNMLGWAYREIRQGLVDIESMFALQGEIPEVRDRPGAQPLEVADGEIRFENVAFAYEPDRQILKDLSFTVPAGAMVAIVGPSGAGKSTLSRILYRFYDVQSGRVLVDGQDIADVTQKSVRAAIGVVPQDTVLFNDTVRYNIRYGRPDAS
ncbi:MAG: ABC transporter transmembrane domain-containing protein, partial [Pseudomonadota bacterium]